MPIWGAIEAGGTNFVCGVGSGPHDLVREEFATGSPEATINRAAAFLKQHGPLLAVGVGSFGPVDLRRGSITTTPKQGWQNVPFVEMLHRELGEDLPIAFDTDVNAAGLGEHRWGGAQGLDTFVYLSVGTGIGAGVLINGRPLHGLMHTEIGHLRIPRNAADDFAGCCDTHGGCLEGLASGTALRERWRLQGALAADEGPERLPPDHEAWALEADYLAHGLVNLILTVSPERIIVGGGVMQQTQRFDLVRARVQGLLGGYLDLPQLGDEGIGPYIVPPALGDDAGVLGALALAQQLAPG